MKKIIYSALVLVSGLTLASCGGQEEYDGYINNLKEQPAAIDTISSATSYSIYLDSLAVKAKNFDQLGLKLNPTQTDELSALSQAIQEALVKKYNELQADSALVDNTVLDASAPVEEAPEGENAVELQ